MPEFPLKSWSANETTQAGEDFGAGLKGGEVIILSGDLGSGKTTFIRGLAAGLGVDAAAEVSSPSYTIVNQYPGRINLVHVDLYRLHDEQEILELALEDLLNDASVMAIEWGERLPAGFPVSMRLHFSAPDDEDEERLIEQM